MKVGGGFYHQWASNESSSMYGGVGDGSPGSPSTSNNVSSEAHKLDTAKSSSDILLKVTITVDGRKQRCFLGAGDRPPAQRPSPDRGLLGQLKHDVRRIRPHRYATAAQEVRLERGACRSVSISHTHCPRSSYLTSSK